MNRKHPKKQYTEKRITDDNIIIVKSNDPNMKISVLRRKEKERGCFDLGF